MTTTNSNDSITPVANRLVTALKETFTTVSGWSGIGAGAITGAIAGGRWITGAFAGAASQIAGRYVANRPASSTAAPQGPASTPN